jgi:hypothetical protein
MDFSQNFSLVMKYDGVSDVMDKLGTRPHGSLVTVKDNRLQIVQGQGEVLVDAPTSEIRVRPAKKVMPGVASIDIGDNHWLVDFSRVHKANQRRSAGIAGKIAAGSALGSFKTMKVGKDIRLQFVSSLGSQGAAVES